MNSTSSSARFVVLLLMTAVLLVAQRGFAEGDTRSINSNHSAITDMHGSEQTLNFTYSIGAMTRSTDGAITADNLNSIVTTAGHPEVPYFSTFIALPPEADINIAVSPLDTQKISDFSVTAAPNDATLSDYDSVTKVLDYSNRTTTPDLAIFETDALYPSALFEVSEPMYQRDMRMVQLKLFPVRVNAVTDSAEISSQLNVNITFTGANLSLSNSASSASGPAEYANILNYDQAQNWHALPEYKAPAGINIPTGVAVYKIVVEEDGLYELTYNDLQAAGMQVDAVNPNTIQLMHRGQNVAYEFVGNNNSTFSQGEKILFYGWAFDGDRFEKQYQEENVFWLWANGSRTSMPTIINTTGYTGSSTTLDTVTIDDDTAFAIGGGGVWTSSPNDPDSWYWISERPVENVPGTISESINLPALNSGSPYRASFELELATRINGTANVSVSLNGHTPQTATWFGNKNLSITQSNIPPTALSNGINSLELDYVATGIRGNSRLYVNRLEVTYPRYLSASGNELIFDSFDTNLSGNYEFRVRNFTTNSTSQLRVYDITNPHLTRKVTIPSNQVIPEGGAYRVDVGVTIPSGGGKYMVTTQGNAKNPLSVTQYIGTNLNPSGGADWVVISHNSFLTQANRLNDHRANFSKKANGNAFKTLTVDYEEVVNQYGYGFDTPRSIIEYMTHAMNTWSTKPSYLVLFGTASYNPRLIDCTSPNCEYSNYTSEIHHIPTNFVFEDRFIGLIPSDHAFSTVVGADLVPDLAVGRLAAQTTASAEDIVDKIIHHEASLQLNHPSKKRYIFISDNADSSGNYCNSNNGVIGLLPSGTFAYNYCLDDYLNIGQGKPELQDHFYRDMRLNGANIVNYRGHGSVGDWGGGIISKSQADRFENHGTAGFILSADCLDGNFTWIGSDALSGAFMRLDQKRGSTSHWSSSGLGYLFEHDVMHNGFYNAALNNGLGRVGDAINSAKVDYLNSGFYVGELKSFILQGDPAMPVIKQANDGGAIAGPLSTPANSYIINNLGVTVTHEFLIINLGTTTDRFNLSISNNNWPTTLSRTTTGLLAPGQRQLLYVTVAIPAGATPGDIDVTNLRVQSRNIDTSSDFEATVTTEIPLVPTSVSLSQSTAQNSNVTALLITLVAITLLVTVAALNRPQRIVN